MIECPQCDEVRGSHYSLAGHLLDVHREAWFGDPWTVCCPCGWRSWQFLTNTNKAAAELARHLCEIPDLQQHYREHQCLQALKQL